MSLEWLQLRPWDGSQQTAFEKLCLQLLSREPVEPGSTFVPKRAPDAGVEGYWRLGSGAEWGLQAKFFLSALGDSQWNQLDKSVARALDCHPKLARYTVAIPQDQSDPRIPNQQWFADKWNARVELWTKWAKQREMNVLFEYWGETELLNRLTEGRNRGLVLFWFNKHTLSTEWMSARVNERIRNVGPRYTPELNVDLPVAFAFEGLERTRQFCEELSRYRIQLQREMRKATRGSAVETVPAEWDNLRSNVQEVCIALLSHVEPATSAMSLTRALDAAGEATGHPALLMIDALNEGEGRLLWMDFLSGVVEALRTYRHIALAISVRDSYTDITIPEELDGSALPQVWHRGFAGHEHVATRTFFDYYGLKAPSIPLLNPEFDNPQFLTLFCKSLTNMGRTEVPRGIAGLSAIFRELSRFCEHKTFQTAGSRF